MGRFQKVSLFRDTISGSLNYLLFPSENWQTNFITDQIRIPRYLDKFCVLVSVAKLGNKTLLDHLLGRWLIIENLDWLLLWHSLVLVERRLL